MSEKRVPLRNWLGLVALTVLVWGLSSAYAENSMGELWSVTGSTPEMGDVGFITANTHLCHTSSITPQTISALDQWAALIERLEAAGGAIFLSEEDNDLGASLGQWCSTLADGYPVIFIITKGDHAIVSWDLSLGFAHRPFIIRLDDFHTGGLEL